jgi:hypothetical protein
MINNDDEYWCFLVRDLGEGYEYDLDPDDPDAVFLGVYYRGDAFSAAQESFPVILKWDNVELTDYDGILVKRSGDCDCFYPIKFTPSLQR